MKKHLHKNNTIREMIIINDFKYMNVYILIDFSRCIYEVYCTDVNYIGRQTIQKLVGPD